MLGPNSTVFIFATAAFRSTKKEQLFTATQKEKRASFWTRMESSRDVVWAHCRRPAGLISKVCLEHASISCAPVSAGGHRC